MQKRGILTKMANCVERKLVELFSDDLSDSEVRESKVKAEVTHKSSNTEVKVSDGNTTATIFFAPDANKRFANMAEVGASFTFFKLEKQSAQTLIFTKTSYMMAEKSVAIVKQERLCLADLVGRKKHEIISGELVVKVWEVNKVIVTGTGRQMQKVKLGDDKFTVELTLWQNDVKAAAALKSGMVVALKNFTMDGFVEKGADQPLNISYRGVRPPLTALRIVGEADVPPHLKNLEYDTMTIKLKGTIGNIDKVSEYNSCPGKPGSRCGKKVMDGDVFCQKLSCRVRVSEAMLDESYYANMTIFADDGEIYTVRCFKDKLEVFEEEGATLMERLAHLEGKQTEVVAEKDNDPSREPVVKDISFPE